MTKLACCLKNAAAYKTYVMERRSDIDISILEMCVLTRIIHSLIDALSQKNSHSLEIMAC